MNDNVENEKYLKKCNKCCTLVREAITYNLLKDRRNQVQNERTRSRKSFQHLEALVIIYLTKKKFTRNFKNTFKISMNKIKNTILYKYFYIYAGN